MVIHNVRSLRLVQAQEDPLFLSDEHVKVAAVPGESFRSLLRLPCPPMEDMMLGLPAVLGSGERGAPGERRSTVAQSRIS